MVAVAVQMDSSLARYDLGLTGPTLVTFLFHSRAALSLAVLDNS